MGKTFKDSREFDRKKDHYLKTNRQRKLKKRLRDQYIDDLPKSKIKQEKEY